MGTALNNSKWYANDMKKELLTNAPRNIKNSSNFMVWTFCVNRTLHRVFAFPQNFYTKKLGKISVFYAVESIFLLYLAMDPLTFSKIKIICVDGNTRKLIFTDK